MRPKTSVVPPGGFHFVDRSGGVEKRIEGESYEDVAKRVLEYRLQNQLPPGNPADEVIRYVCETWPHFCVGAEPPRPVRQSPGTLSNRVAAWVADVYNRFPSDPGVSAAEAARRAAICAACPKNVGYRGGCGSCVRNIERLAFVLVRGRETPKGNELAACAVLGQLNPVAVLSEQLPEVAQEDAAELPLECWRKPV